jgi:undecaprenyl-diphosphatase
LISFALVNILKIAIGKPRPSTEGLFHPFSTSGKYHALPSGHTSEITGAAIPFAHWAQHSILSLFLGIIIAMVGFSRIYLGWHHPTDILCGWLIGSYAGALITAYGLRHNYNQLSH